MEGYPFGPPPSAVLVSTRRTARYLQLEAAVGGAVSAAYGEAPRDAAAAAGDEAREVAGLPSLLEVMELVGGQVRAAAGPTSLTPVLALSSERITLKTNNKQQGLPMARRRDPSSRFGSRTMLGTFVCTHSAALFLPAGKCATCSRSDATSCRP